MKMTKKIILIILSVILVGAVSAAVITVAAKNKKDIKKPTEELTTEAVSKTENKEEEKETEKVPEPLEFEMKEVNFEHKTSSGVLVSTNKIVYPLFKGNSAAAKKINSYFEERINTLKEIEGGTDKMYSEIYEYAHDKLPLYYNITADVTYNKNGFISIFFEEVEWAGGAHPYSAFGGLNYDTVSGEKLTYDDLIKGGKKQVRSYIAECFKKDIPEGISVEYGNKFDETLKDTPFNLTDKGICFHYYAFALAPNVEAVVPYAKGNEPFAIAPENTTEPSSESDENGEGSLSVTLSEEEIISLFRKANKFYIGWIEHGPKVEYDPDKIIEVNGMEYLPVVNSKYSSIAQIKKAASTMFEEKTYSAAIDRLYTMHDKKLYALISSGQGGDVSPVSYKLKILSKTETSYEFTITTYYENDDQYAGVLNRLTLVNGNWIFTNGFNSLFGFEDIFN
jgi:hypothetical protein